MKIVFYKVKDLPVFKCIKYMEQTPTNQKVAILLSIMMNGGNKITLITCLALQFAVVVTYF
jgi:hypothetical protein